MINKCLKIRDDLQMSQRELARELGVTQAHICRLEKGKRKISASIALKFKSLAKKKGIDLDLNKFMV